MSRAGKVIGLALLVCFLPRDEWAQGPAAPFPVLTLDDAIHRAEANEPALAAAAAESRATALERTDARTALLPSVTYHNQYLFTQSNHTQSQTTQGGVDQSLPVFIANNAVHEYSSQGSVNEAIGLAQVGAVRLADARAAVAMAEAEVARRGLVAAVVTLFYNVTATTERVAIASGALDEAARFVQITQQRETAREAAHADVVKAQLGQQQRERELADARLAETRAHVELGVLVFPDPGSRFSVTSSGAPPALPEKTSVEAMARAGNPELRSALAALQAGRAETALAQAALLPDLAMNFTYGIDAPQLARQGTDGAKFLGYSASVTLDVPVWDWLTTERKVKEARIRAGAARVALTAAQRRLIADLAEFYGEAQEAQQQLTSLGSSVQTARESLRLTNLRYVDGEGTVLDVVDAQNTLRSAENARVDGELRYRLALGQLETLTGRL